jgi:signal transduction histidine kinase
MKLRSKLFFSYLFLIVIFSFSLFWLLIEIRELTLSFQRHAHQDVKGIISVSEQLQILEDMNSEYKLLFFPEKSVADGIRNVEETRIKFHSQWKTLGKIISFEQRRNWADKITGYLYTLFFKIVGERDFISQEEEIKFNVGDVEKFWNLTNQAIKETIPAIRINNIARARSIRDNRYSDNIKCLRESLSSLNKVLGKRGQMKSVQMASIARKTQWVILWTEIGLILLTIVLAFLVSRKLTKPIPELKEAMDRIAIQDFDILIKNKTNDEIGELSVAFEQLSERLREANSYKTGMLSQFTHEMKSPLGSIKQATTLLETTMTGKTSQQDRFLRIIKNNYETLFNIINNILHSASFSVEKIKLKLKKIDIAILVKKVLVDMSPLIHEKRQKVYISTNIKNIDCEVDEERFKEVLHNIMSNAVKFSPENAHIDVRITTKLPMVIIKVRDQGIGIPRKEIPYIFEKMYRASNSKKISVKGTGLGLYISSQIIKAHGGRIMVESEEGKGSTFIIKMPRTRRAAEEGGWLEP